MGRDVGGAPFLFRLIRTTAHRVDYISGGIDSKDDDRLVDSEVGDCVAAADKGKEAGPYLYPSGAEVALPVFQKVDAVDVDLVPAEGDTLYFAPLPEGFLDLGLDEPVREIEKQSKNRDKKDQDNCKDDNDLFLKEACSHVASRSPRQGVKCRRPMGRPLRIVPLPRTL